MLPNFDPTVPLVQLCEHGLDVRVCGCRVVDLGHPPECACHDCDPEDFDPDAHCVHIITMGEGDQGTPACCRCQTADDDGPCPVPEIGQGFLCRDDYEAEMQSIDNGLLEAAL